jgi:hypothetical protein
MAVDAPSWTSLTRIAAVFAAGVLAAWWLVERTETTPAALSEIPELRKDVAEVGERVARVEGKLDVLLLKDRPRSAGYAAKE